MHTDIVCWVKESNFPNTLSDFSIDSFASYDIFLHETISNLAHSESLSPVTFTCSICCWHHDSLSGLNCQYLDFAIAMYVWL